MGLLSFFARRDPVLAAAETRLTQLIEQAWGEFVDPADRFRDDATGETWLPVGVGKDGNWLDRHFDLGAVRKECRQLAECNEWAINGHENRISYIVGAGSLPQAVAAKGVTPSDELLAAAQAVLAEFCRVNRWTQRQQEFVRRLDRDGEVFRRFFPQQDGIVRVRWIEPEQVATPDSLNGRINSSIRYGIRFDPDDSETVLGYFVDGSEQEPDDIQHVKANVDANVARGCPLFYPVRKNLRRAERILRNASTVIEIQSAIAIIRKIKAGTKAAAQSLVTSRATITQQAPAGSGSYTPKDRTFERYGPGTILTGSDAIDYEFPAAGINAANYVVSLQAELRAIAARLVMPEFMFTSDASNANYASTMVAEGPAVRMFERMQALIREADLEVYERVLDGAAQNGSRQVPANWRDYLTLQIQSPSLAVRDRLQEAQANQIEMVAGVLSPQTWSQVRGYDYEQQQAQIEAYKERVPERALPGLDDAAAGDEPPVVATADSTAAIAKDATAAVADTGLNGAQVTALLDVLAKVGDGTLTPAGGVALIAAAFPLLPVEKIRAIVGGVESVATPEPPPVVVPQSTTPRDINNGT